MSYDKTSVRTPAASVIHWIVQYLLTFHRCLCGNEDKYVHLFLQVFKKIKIELLQLKIPSGIYLYITFQQRSGKLVQGHRFLVKFFCPSKWQNLGTVTAERVGHKMVAMWKRRWSLETL